jgi:hypothetical protein
MAYYECLLTRLNLWLRGPVSPRWEALNFNGIFDRPTALQIQVGYGKVKYGAGDYGMYVGRTVFVAVRLGQYQSGCHPSEGTSKNRTQIPIVHMFCLFSAPPSLGGNRILP